MKELIFTEFLEMVEKKFDYKKVDHIIADAKDPNEGAFTSVNFYDHAQLTNTVAAFHKRSGIPLHDLMKTYGELLLGSLLRNYPNLIDGFTDSFEKLLNIEVLIHKEVRKLYSQSNLPRFTGIRLDGKMIELIYNSHRSMGDIFEGLIFGCGARFGKEFRVEQLSDQNKGKRVKFGIERI